MDIPKTDGDARQVVAVLEMVVTRLERIEHVKINLKTHAVDTMIGCLSQDFSDVKILLERIEARLQRLETLMNM